MGEYVLSLVGCFAIGWWATGLFFSWREKQRARAVEWVRGLEHQLPGRCVLCSYTRWGRSMGFASAFDPVEPHDCIEGNERPPYPGPCGDVQ